MMEENKIVENENVNGLSWRRQNNNNRNTGWQNKTTTRLDRSWVGSWSRCRRRHRRVFSFLGDTASFSNSKIIYLADTTWATGRAVWMHTNHRIHKVKKSYVTTVESHSHVISHFNSTPTSKKSYFVDGGWSSEFNLKDFCQLMKTNSQTLHVQRQSSSWPSSCRKYKIYAVWF